MYIYVNFFKFSDINGRTYTNLTLGLSQSLQNTFLKLASDQNILRNISNLCITCIEEIGLIFIKNNQTIFLVKNLLFLFDSNFPLTNSEVQYYKNIEIFLIYKNLITEKLSSEAINSTNINLAYIAHVGDIVGLVPVLNIFTEIVTTKCISQ